MATAIIKATLPGLRNFAGMTAKMWAHPGTQNAAAVRTIATVTVDTADDTTYWMTVDAASPDVLSGPYRIKFLEGTTERGAGYVKMTNTASVHVVVGSPAELGAIDGTSAGISADVANKIADHTKRRSQANVEASSDGDTLGLSSEYGFVQQAQESRVASGTLTVYKTDGTTVLGTKSVDSDENAEPVVGVS